LKYRVNACFGTKAWHIYYICLLFSVHEKPLFQAKKLSCIK
jgi:hypothetical protein